MRHILAYAGCRMYTGSTVLLYRNYYYIEYYYIELIFNTKPLDWPWARLIVLPYRKYYYIENITITSNYSMQNHWTGPVYHITIPKILLYRILLYRVTTVVFEKVSF